MTSTRKRALEEDDDEDSFFKRRRLLDANDVEGRLKGLLAGVCDLTVSSVESNLERLAQTLHSEHDLFRESLLKVIPQCVCFLPDRMTVFSTLLGLLNKMNHTFGGEMLEAVLEKLNLKFETNNYAHALRLMIFLANTVNSRVISLSSYFHYLEGIMETALEEDIPQVRSDWFIYALLRCLPYVGRELFESDEEGLENILEQIGVYIAQRNKDYVKMLQVWSASPHEQEDYLDCLWAQITKLREDEWREKHILRYHVAFDGTLADALRHNISDFKAPTHSADSVYPLPSVVFRLFDYADCPEEGPLLPGAHSIERFLIEEDLCWIIEQNIWNRKECATELLDYQKRHTIPINYMALEVIFAQLFRLPEPPTKSLFYGSLLIELCKIQPTSMPQVIAQATELLYQRLDSMHFSAVDQMIDWFSYHMSNFEYRWSWSEWSDCLQLDKLSPKHFFIREALHKCVRLSYHERIVNCLPESFHRILASKPFITYNLEDEGAPTASLAVRLTERMRTKMTAEEMIEALVAEQANDDANDELVLSTFVAVLLNLAKKTISHSFAALTRYFKTLKQLASSEESQLIVLKTLYSVWKHNQQMMSVIAKKMVTMTVVDETTIVAWIFSDEMKPEFERMWTWELLCDSVQHVIGHLRRCRTKIEKAQQKGKSSKKVDIDKDENANGELSKDDDGDDDDDETNEDDLNALENEYEDLHEYVQNLLLNVLHKFTIKLTEHIIICDTKSEDVNTSWFRYFTSRFRGFFLKHYKEIFEFRETIEKQLFKAHAIDAQVMETYTMFISLQS